MHSGTTNADKILNWIDLLGAIAGRDLETKPRTVKGWLKALRLQDWLKDYFTARHELFKDEAAQEAA